MVLPRADVLVRVRTLLEVRLQLGTGDGPIGESSGLLGEGIGLDSVEVLQLVAAAEEAFDITVADDELLPEHFQTVGTFVDFIEARLRA